MGDKWGDKWPYKTVEKISKKVAMGPFGSSIKVSTFVDEGVPVISGQHLHGFRLDDTPGYKFITEDHANKLKNTNAFKGDIVFTHAGNIGQVAYIPASSIFDRYVLSQRQFYMRCDVSQAIPEFVTYYFHSPEGRHKLLANASQVGVPSISRPVSNLKTITIPVPPISEQRAIAHILGSLDDKIELNRQMAQTFESIARAIFKSWFVDFDPVKAKMEGKQPEGMTEEIAALFPDRLVDSELEMIPEGWDIATMQDLGTIKGGATPSTKNPDYWEGGTNHWITPKDMSNLDSIVVLDTSRKITDSGMQRISSRQLPAGTVLMSSRAPVGYLAISAIPISINQGFIAIVCNKSIPNSYVLYLLESNMDKIKMSSGGSTFSEISKRNFRPIKILLPNKDLLVKFNEIIEPIVDKMTRLQREVTTLSSLRDALLPKLISGELRIKDFERFLGKVA